MRSSSQKIFFIFSFILVGFFSNNATADSARSSHRLGVFLGLLGEPLPVVASLNAGLNIFDFLRVSGGYGSVSTDAVSIKTTGGSAKLFIPGWNFSPTFGLGYAKISYSGSDTFGGFSGSASHTYTIFGFDWTAPIGFYFGMGAAVSISSTGGLPYISLGWFL